MFNLDLAIADWRRHMSTSGFNSIKVLDEFECHLRDDIEAQVLAGVNEERAFELAIRHLGTPAELIKQFANSPQRAAMSPRTFLRCFYFLCATAAVLIGLWSLISFDLSSLQRISAAGGLVLFALYGFALPFWLERQIRTSALFRAMKVLSLMMSLWVLFALSSALSLVHYKVGIFPEMIMWSLCAVHGLTALACAAGFGGHGGTGRAGVFCLPGSLAGLPFLPDVHVPPSDAFTPAARQALELAREEALKLGHDFVGTEHVLLGLLPTAGEGLEHTLQTNGEAVRAEIRRLISAFPGRPAICEPPLTPRARKALQLAGREARALKPSPIGTGHILLGLLLEGSGVAAIALGNLGVRLEQLRAEIPKD